MGLPVLAVGPVGSGLFAGTEKGSTAEDTRVMRGSCGRLNEGWCWNSLVSAGQSAAARSATLVLAPSQGSAGGSHGGGGLLESG